VKLADERPQRPFVALTLTGDQFPAALPGGEDRERRDGDEQWKPGSVHELGQVGGEEEKVDGEQGAGAGRHDPPWCAPLITDDVEEKQGRDRDRAGHRHAVRVGQCG